MISLSLKLPLFDLPSQSYLDLNRACFESLNLGNRRLTRHLSGKSLLFTCRVFSPGRGKRRRGHKGGAKGGRWRKKLSILSLNREETIIRINLFKHNFSDWVQGIDQPKEWRSIEKSSLVPESGSKWTVVTSRYSWLFSVSPILLLLVFCQAHIFLWIENHQHWSLLNFHICYVIC